MTYQAVKRKIFDVENQQSIKKGDGFQKDTAALKLS